MLDGKGMAGEFDAQVRIPWQGQLRNVKNDAAQCKYVSVSMSKKMAGRALGGVTYTRSLSCYVNGSLSILH